MSRTLKRTHTGEVKVLAKKQKLRNGHAKVVLRAQPVRGDALKWKEVDLPDRLEDAEGFFGLEEIEDVEVVKDVAGQNVLFRARPDAVEDAGLNTEEGGEDWTGFEDELSAAPLETASRPLSKDKNVSAQTEQPVKSILKKKDVADEIDADHLGFDILNDVEEDSQADVSAWAELNLSISLLAAFARLGFLKPTAIQATSIPAIMRGDDVIGKAVTGSGKTLAFGVPIFESWLQSQPSSAYGAVKNPTALILAPTRELAHQLNKHLYALGEELDRAPQIATVTGGLSILKQQRQLEYADIIIGTPGRLWEVISDSTGLIARLKAIKFLVVDEADRLLSEGHFKEVEDILDTLDREILNEQGESDMSSNKSQRQTLVFSATFHKGLQQKLTGKSRPGSNELLSNKDSMSYLLRKLNFRSEKPVFIDSNPTSQMASNLSETIVECPAMSKDLYLYALLLQNTSAKTLVFVNSISAVKRLTPLLQNLNQPAVALHSTMPQKSRLRSLEKFTSQRTVLIATDVAARGLDIKGVDLIIHYHVPRTADMYVHRSGRTARAEHSGKSVLLCSPDEVVSVTRLVAKIHKSRAPETVHMDHRMITRLTPRINLSQKITDSTIAKEKLGSQDEWLRTAANELGVDYDSEEFEKEGKRGKRGRGGGNAEKQKEKGGVSKAEIASWKAQLKDQLGKKVNLGVSERYLAGGKVDVDALLAGSADSNFLDGRGV